MDERQLELVRDRCLDRLSIEEVSWAVQRLSRMDKQRLLRIVGLELDPKFLRSGMGPLIQARIAQVGSTNRWSAATLLQKRCLEEFARVLGTAFEDPTLEQLSDAVPRVVLSCGSTLVKLTLSVGVHREAKAADHLRSILELPEWRDADPPDGMAAPTQRGGTQSSALKVGLAGSSNASGHGRLVGPDISSQHLLLPLRRMQQRADAAMHDSDATYYASLILLGEMLTKLTAISLIASIDPELDENLIAYSTQHSLLRADGIGSWASAIQDLTTAPVYRLLGSQARQFHSSMTQRFGAESESWQRHATDSLAKAAACFPVLSSERAVGKVPLSQWFQSFAALRNKTRGHGADLVSWQASATAPLADSLNTLMGELGALRWNWWYVHRTAAMRYKFAAIAGDPDRRAPDVPADLEQSVYVVPEGQLRGVRLLRTDIDLSDFFLPNGDANDSRETYEELSYISGQKRWAPLKDFMRPPRVLPASETQGSAELRAVGNVLTNLPEPRLDYVRRDSLEADLKSVLMDSRHPVVAINGPGGIGKTSLALQVLHDLAEREAFTAILWFSARDIDLDPIRGPLAVRPAAQSLIQIARQYAGYIEPKKLTSLGADDLIESFLKSLSENEAGPIMYVFDNFETVHNPAHLFRELNEFVRLPNKILITTRYRDFKGDWPLDVDGMSRPEFDALVASTASRLNVTGLISGHAGWLDSLFRESGGHPYVVNVALGEVARTRKVGQKFDRIMASKDEILDALFERSFNRLSPQAQRVFFTLCRWRARIPSIALEAVLTRPACPRIDVEGALNHLIDSSLVERTYSEVDAESFLYVPAAAYRFGSKQMKFSDIADVVDEDARYLHLFGAVSDNVEKTGFSPHVHRFYDNARALTGSQYIEAIAIGEYVARRYPESWLLLARLQRQEVPSGRVAAKGSYQSYLSRMPDDADAWLELAELGRETRDDMCELRASAQASQIADRRYTALSESLGTLRERCDQGLTKVESKQKRSFLLALCRGWHPRENQASMSDCYNLARLAERAGAPEEALFWAEHGLRRDRRNQRLQEIRESAMRLIRSGR